MKNWHKESFLVDDTHIDFSNNVPVYELIKFFQIATFNHSSKMGLDHASMLEKSNAFWVVTKLKLKLSNKIKSSDRITATTWTHELGGVRALRDCVIKKKNLIVANCSSEWCCLDFETRRLRKMNSISYPTLEMEKTKRLNVNFTNMRESICEKDFVYSRVIHSTDIDTNNHTNNLKYNQMALDSFSVDELKGIDISEYEIYFVNESHEKDIINIHRKKLKNCYYIEGICSDKTIFKVVIKYKKKTTNV